MILGVFLFGERRQHSNEINIRMRRGKDVYLLYPFQRYTRDIGGIHIEKGE